MDLLTFAIREKLKEYITYLVQEVGFTSNVDVLNYLVSRIMIINQAFEYIGFEQIKLDRDFMEAINDALK